MSFFSLQEEPVLSPKPGEGSEGIVEGTLRNDSILTLFRQLLRQATDTCHCPYLHMIITESNVGDSAADSFIEAQLLLSLAILVD